MHSWISVDGTFDTFLLNGNFLCSSRTFDNTTFWNESVFGVLSLLTSSMFWPLPSIVKDQMASKELEWIDLQYIFRWNVVKASKSDGKTIQNEHYKIAWLSLFTKKWLLRWPWIYLHIWLTLDCMVANISKSKINICHVYHPSNFHSLYRKNRTYKSLPSSDTKHQLN